MENSLLDTISREVYQRFPQVAGSRPKVQESSEAGAGNRVLVYRGSSTTSDGKRISHIVRVTVNERGKIIKVSSSR